MSQPNAQPLDRLKNGIRRFQDEVYPAHSEAYRTAATTPQKPYALIISCADSRIDLETITSSSPGEIFVSRNVGNMVPPYGGQLGGVSAVIEYAVDALKVKHAVVCGHTDCGAMKALRVSETGSLDALPTVKLWLDNAEAAKSVARSIDKDEVSLPTLTEQNVLLQLAHLQTHPSVRGAMARGELTISGWVYNIETGDVTIFNPESNRFESTRENASAGHEISSLATVGANA